MKKKIFILVLPVFLLPAFLFAQVSVVDSAGFSNILEEIGNFIRQWNVVLVIAAWVLAILIGLIVVHSWKAQLNTALPKKEADTYVVPGSLVFTSKKDTFLYSRVTKTQRQSSSTSLPPSSSSLSGRAGGARISSSGRSYISRGGKY